MFLKQSSVVSTGGLAVSTTFEAVIYASNAKGRGDTVALPVYTLKDNAEKRTGMS